MPNPVEVLQDPDIFHHTTQQFREANQATTNKTSRDRIPSYHQ
ncbi:14652_t:CDS:2 [Acaulospora morrowiae]|uniref:14652_t:CDS:1 n=1 Tax=Acaulospora morrowiae TaxID=94023 RepID=A0A9N8YSB6_9GLOM|nr:14652_t:CDS:2 [Acaulospora morrowiae]